MGLVKVLHRKIQDKKKKNTPLVAIFGVEGSHSAFACYSIMQTIQTSVRCSSDKYDKTKKKIIVVMRKCPRFLWLQLIHQPYFVILYSIYVKDHDQRISNLDLRLR